MARDTMGLTIADLETLCILVQAEPRSYNAAAAFVGYDRARLARLIERVNHHIGEHLDWRENRRFRPPPEVRRLVLRYAAFAQELGELGRAPRVSAGTCATFLLGEVLVELGRKPPRLAVVRSKDALHALEGDEIDIALVHGSSVGISPSQPQRQLKESLTGFALLRWKTVVVKQHNAGMQGERGHFRACWEPGSTGDRLNRETGMESSSGTSLAVGLPCQSFLQAIELARRGLIAEVVVPDIYLPKPSPDLVVERLATPTEDQLVAIFRTAEGPRWAWLLDRLIWEQVAERSRGMWSNLRT